MLVVYCRVEIGVPKMMDFAIKMPNSDSETSGSESSESSVLLVLILALKVIEVVLQKAQNWRLKVITVTCQIHDRKFCHFFENNS